MKSPSLFFTVIFVIAAITSGALAREETAPAGHAQLENTPRLIPGGTDEKGRQFSYLGQGATNGKLILTASNGFFTGRVATARGQSTLPKKGDAELIAPNFGWLEWTGTDHSLRWHILVKQPGSANLRVHMEVEKPSSTIRVQFAGQEKTVRTARSSAEESQPWELDFRLEKPGEYTLSLEATDVTAGTIGNLHRIDIFGPAISDAELLRVRWRPAAVHAGYDTSKVKNARLVVIASRSMEPISNYSPVTTPFGYFGTSFEDDQRSNGSFNFSMWGKDSAADNIRTMPHLIGLGSPEGEFSGFGHEGCGVKPRGWDPMPDRPGLVVQALRVENHELYDTYFGYYFDQPTNSWKFYAAGNKWHGGKPVNHLKLGSFCEVPGPPDRQRTGDVYREIRRRAWAWDGDTWVALDQYRPGGEGSSGNLPVNKLWYTTDEGEYAMGCGGIRLYTHDPKQITAATGDSPLPGYLSNPTTKNLFQLPIEIRSIQVADLSGHQATIEYTVSSDEDPVNGSIFFGTRDALTFAPRELHGTERNSKLSRSLQEMAWEHQSDIERVTQGINRVTLKSLEPETRYYFRILVNGTENRIWSGDTFDFTTPK